MAEDIFPVATDDFIGTSDTLFGESIPPRDQVNPRALAEQSNQAGTRTISNATITNNDSAQPVKTFFDKYFTNPISFPAGEVDAVVGFFEKRKFEKIAAINVATILLTQARLDNVKIFLLLDTLKGLTDLQLSNVVTEILNVNRSKISTLGFKVTNNQNQFEKRNIVV
jgi:hypothetical protein